MTKNEQEAVCVAYFTSQAMVDRFLLECEANLPDWWVWQVQPHLTVLNDFPEFTVMWIRGWP